MRAFSRKVAFSCEKAPEGAGAGGGPHRVAADPRGSPHKPSKERRGGGSLPGVERYARGALIGPLTPMLFQKRGGFPFLGLFALS
jgi:hypothetical protein